MFGEKKVFFEFFTLYHQSQVFVFSMDFETLALFHVSEMCKIEKRLKVYDENTLKHIDSKQSIFNRLNSSFNRSFQFQPTKVVNWILRSI